MLVRKTTSAIFTATLITLASTTVYAQNRYWQLASATPSHGYVDHGSALTRTPPAFQEPSQVESFQLPYWMHPGEPSSPALGAFFRYDRMHFTLSSPDLVEIGDPGSERIGTVNTVPYPIVNSLNTEFIDGSPTGGDRFEFGYMNKGKGWIATINSMRQTSGISVGGGLIVFNDPTGMLLGYQDGNADGFDDDLNGNAVYGRNGLDLGTPSGGTFVLPLDGTPDTPAAADLGDLVTYFQTFGTVAVTNRFSLSGFELMRSYFYPIHAGRGSIEFFLGTRVMNVEESFGVQMSGTSGTGGAFWDSGNIQTHVENLIVGPQFGTRISRRKGPFAIIFDGRFLLGTNFQNVQQSGEMLTSGSPGAANQPVNLLPFSSNNSANRTEFAPVGEWRVEAVYQPFSWGAVKVGYTGTYIGGVGRASTRVNYTIPDFGIADASSNVGLFQNAITFGMEINR